MRRWIIAAFAVLSLGMMVPSPAEASPAVGQDTQDLSAAASCQPQDVRNRHRHHRRYVTRCHNVRVWKWTHHGRRPVWVRRCHRVWR